MNYPNKNLQKKYIWKLKLDGPIKRLLHEHNSFFLPRIIVNASMDRIRPLH